MSENLVLSNARACAPSFPAWHEAGFTSELLPIIPPGVELTANTTVRPEHRGKTPGVKNHIGTWSGLHGKWPEELFATLDSLKKWDAWGASVDLQSRKFLGLDVDVEDDRVAPAIVQLAQDYLGLAPRRYRDGSPRALLMYIAVEGEFVPKHRIAWLDSAGKKQIVELLGHGQQYVVHGPHPKGGEYLWSEQPASAELTPVPLANVAQFFDAVRGLVERSGWAISTGSTGAAGSTTRKSLADTVLAE
jgi:Bifunctional DNA primase/polymerase, N-terminal